MAGNHLDAKVVLLDIEGTVCPISFVKDVLFPFALKALPSTLSTQWDSPDFLPYRDAFPSEYNSSPETFQAHVEDLMSRDLKIPYLKSLQGHLWLQGYESGALSCPLFADVFPALLAWHKASISIIIYSSGSVPAQKLLFQYTNSQPFADLRSLITDYFDTVNAGPKTEAESYKKIAGAHPQLGEIGEWLFLSDNVKEVDAAKEAGMRSFIVVREGNAPLTEDDKGNNISVESFDKIHIAGGGTAEGYIESPAKESTRKSAPRKPGHRVSKALKEERELRRSGRNRQQVPPRVSTGDSPNSKRQKVEDP